MLRTILLILSFAVGWFCPALAVLKPFMAFILTYMLTVVFLRMSFTRGIFAWRHVIILLANALLPLAIWKGMILFGAPERFAQAAFFTAITPSATAAPVIINLLGGSLTFATAGFLFNTFTMSALLPILIPIVLHKPFLGALPQTFYQESAPLWCRISDLIMWVATQPIGIILMRVLLVTLVPLCIALILRQKFGAHAVKWGKKLSPSTIYVWVVLVMIIAASASETLTAHAQEFPKTDVLWVIVIDFILCVGLFALGALIGNPNHLRECSQLLGQKNTSYTTYLAFACDAPFAALGPAFYVFFHNAWNGIQLIAHSKKSKSHRRSKRINIHECDSDHSTIEQVFSPLE